MKSMFNLTTGGVLMMVLAPVIYVISIQSMPDLKGDTILVGFLSALITMGTHIISKALTQKDEDLIQIKKELEK